MPQCVQNTFKNHLKMAANGQFRAAYRRREPAYISVPWGKNPILLHMKKKLWIFFTPYKLQITSFQMTKLVQKATNFNPKNII